MQKSCQALTESWLKAPEQLHHLEQLDCLLITQLEQQNRQAKHECLIKITNKMLEMSLEAEKTQKQSPDHKTINMVQLWQIYVQMLRSYNFRCLDLGFDERNWIFCWLATCLLLEGYQVQKDPPNILKQTDILAKISEVQKDKRLKLFFQKRLFHQLSLLLRIFISPIDQFLGSDNRIVKKSPRHPQINNCTLLMDIIKSQLLPQAANRQPTEQVKLGCLMLLMAVMETKIRPSPNYNQILQFAIYITLLIEDENKKQDSLVLFYCGQLVSMVVYRNCHEVTKLCRSDKQNSKILHRILHLYRHSLHQAAQHINSYDYEEIVYKRLVFGFCGLLQIDKMETAVEETVKQEAGTVIAMIQYQYGWRDEDPEQESSQSRQKQEHNEQIWDEEYYTKHRVTTFEEQQVVDVLLRSMCSIKEHNCAIFEAIMDNFDEKQSLMWMVELERYGQQVEDD